MPHALQNRRWMFFFPNPSGSCRSAEPLAGAFLRQLSVACRSRPVPFVEMEEAGQESRHPSA